jgi:hypothetical protein
VSGGDGRTSATQSRGGDAIGWWDDGATARSSTGSAIDGGVAGQPGGPGGSSGTSAPTSF